jgi:hypothetical protein
MEKFLHIVAHKTRHVNRGSRRGWWVDIQNPQVTPPPGSTVGLAVAVPRPGRLVPVVSTV